MDKEKPKKRSLIQRILLWTATIIFILFSLLILILYIKREDVGQAVKKKFNANIQAHLDYNEVGITFKHFPSIGFCLTDISLIGTNTFEGDTLATLSELDLAFNLRTLLPGSDQMIIEKVNLRGLNLHLHVLENGTANYDIIKQKSDGGSSREKSGAGPALKLSGYSITESNIIFQDDQNNIEIWARDLDHSGRGNFQQALFDLMTTSRIGSLSVFQAGIPYLLHTKFKLENTLTVDMGTNRYNLNETLLSLNDLEIQLEGSVAMPTNGPMKLDLSFASPQNQFKSLFSILPHAYTKDFSQLDANGNFILNGELNYTENLFPHFNLDLNVENGSFKYPGMEYGFNSINLSAKAENSGNDADDTKVDINKFRFLLNDIPFDGKFKLTKPISDPVFDLHLKGATDLKMISRTLPTVNLEELGGSMDVDIKSAGNFSAIEEENWEALTLSGKIVIDDLIYKYKDQPKVTSKTIGLNADLDLAKLTMEDLIIGNSDINGTVIFSDPLKMLLANAELKGNITLRSENLDLNSLQSLSTSEEEVQGYNEAAAYPSYLEHLNILFDTRIENFTYSDYNLLQTKATGSYAGQKLDVKNLETTYDGSRITGSGMLDNLLSYIYLGEILKGELNIMTDKFDMNKFTATKPSPKTASEPQDQAEALAPQVPENLDIDLNITSRQLKIQRVELVNTEAVISVNNKTAKIEKLTAGGLGGKIAFSGSYSTAEPAKPKLVLTYDVRRLDFQATFEQLATVPVLAPVIQYIEGKFTSRLDMSAELNSNLMPIMSTLNADGYIETLEGVISKFPPFAKISELLGLKTFENIKLYDTRNWFEIKNGKVNVEPFTIQEKDVTMTISGTHGLDQSMDYDIKMHLPYSLIEEKFDQESSLASLKSQANRIGFDLSKAFNVDILIKMTGRLNDPNLEISLLSDNQQEVKDQIKQVVDEKIDSFKQVGEDKLDTIRKEFETQIDENKLKAARKIDEQINSLLSNAERTSKDIKDEAQKLANKIREEGNNQANALIEEAGDNPFKKLAAETAAKKIRNEADKQAGQLVVEANNKAENILIKANQKADSLRLEKKNILQ